MAESIAIVGALTDQPDWKVLRDGLAAISDEEIEWSWVTATLPHGNANQAEFRKLLAKFWNKSIVDKPRVVKLFTLHHRDQHQLYSVCTPIPAPKEVLTSSQLFDWLVLPETNLIPRREWWACVEEAALIALLCKLVKDKSWNKNTQGHAWTREQHLFHDAPVDRPGFGQILAVAKSLISTLTGKLFLRKGASQGKTPLEWCINLAYLPKVKRCILDRSVDHLREIPGLDSLVHRIKCSTEKHLDLTRTWLTRRCVTTAALPTNRNKIAPENSSAESRKVFQVVVEATTAITCGAEWRRER